MAAQQAALQQRQVQARELKKEAADNSLLIARSRGTEYNDAAFKRNSVRQGEAAARERKRREKVMMVDFLRKRAEEQRSEEVDEVHPPLTRAVLRVCQCVAIACVHAS